MRNAWMARSELSDCHAFRVLPFETPRDAPLDHVPVTPQPPRRDMLPALVIGLLLSAGALGLLMGWPK